ncbi:MAG: YHYH protein [Aureispira sp.]|nr:YHYH protein [Aureispira sp.]
MQIQDILAIAAICGLMGCGASSPNTVQNSKAAIPITNLSELNFQEEYSIRSAEYGTETKVFFKEGYRIMKTNALPNHPTGTFPNAGNPNSISAQDLSYRFPLEPKLSGESKWAREPGVALNGVKFEPETAERFVCETGEVYRIEAFQELVDLGLDFNHAHVQPTGAYHYHGVPKGLVEALDSKEDIVLIGFALDGFPIYYSKSNKYKPSYQLGKELRTGDACSYRNPKHGMDKVLKDTRPDGTFVSDWEYKEGLGQLDECNGIELDGQYAYFVTDEYPYMSRCLKGVFKEERPKGPPPGHRHGHHPPPHHHPHPHRQ